MTAYIIQGCAVILVLAIFQPAHLKSLKSETEEAPQHLARDKREEKDDPILYPDTSLRMLEIINDPTPCPEGQSYCESADDYPTNHIKDLIKKQPKLLLDQLYVEVDNTQVDKFGPGAFGDDESKLCYSTEKIIYPNKARSQEGSFEFVVNDDQHRQGVRVEACVSRGNNNNQCNIPGNLALGYSSRCVQKHIFRTLVVLNKNSSGVSGFVTKPFDFPSCCSCVIVNNSGNKFGFTAVNTTSASPGGR